MRFFLFMCDLRHDTDECVCVFYDFLRSRQTNIMHSAFACEQKILILLAYECIVRPCGQTYACSLESLHITHGAADWGKTITSFHVPNSVCSAYTHAHTNTYFVVAIPSGDAERAQIASRSPHTVPLISPFHSSIYARIWAPPPQKAHTHLYTRK